MRITGGNCLLGCLGAWCLRARACHYEHFPRWVQRERAPFSIYSLVSVEARPVSKNCSCSWSARAPRLPLFARAFMSARRSIQPSTLLYGFGGDRVPHIGLFSTLYTALLHHATLLRLSECEWVSGCERIKICDITDCCFIFCWHTFPLPAHSSWGFCAIYGYLTGALNRS